jgi:hypothetical protein
MAEIALTIALLAAAFIHLAPAIGVLSAQKLHALYGVQPDATTLLLLRHRALLFAVIGSGLLIAVFVPEWRVAASGVALFCMLSFIALAAGQTFGPAIQRVVRIDVAVSAALGAALIAKLLLGRA